MGSDYQAGGDITSIIAGSGVLAGGEFGDVTIQIGDLVLDQFATGVLQTAGNFSSSDNSIPTSAAVSGYIDGLGLSGEGIVLF